MDNLELILDAVFQKAHSVGYDAGRGTVRDDVRYLIGIWNSLDDFKPIVDIPFRDLGEAIRIKPDYPNAVICSYVPSDSTGAMTNIALYAENPIAAWVIPIPVKKEDDNDKIADGDEPTKGETPAKDEVDIEELEDDDRE